jgi:hypothetical protein
LDVDSAEEFPAEVLEAFDGRPPKFVEDTSDEEASDKENTGNVCGVKRKAVELGSASGLNIGSRPKRRVVAPDRLNL